MRSKHSLRWIAVATVLVAGCATARQYPAPPLSAAQLVEIGAWSSGADHVPIFQFAPSSMRLWSCQ